MNATKPTPDTLSVDSFAIFLSRYEALEALINDGTDVMQIRSLLDAINEGFRAELDRMDAK